MNFQKTAAAIHDISGLGKCSLTAALPVLSAAGVSVGVLPTAVLSTQTGGLNNYTYRDLTDDIPGIMNHWDSIGVEFDAVYSGFLGSEMQVGLVSEFVRKFSKPDAVFLCDPAMADNGKLYDTFDADFIEQMKKLCMKADIIVPNFTEAAMLLDEEYILPPYSDRYVTDLVVKLAGRFNSRYIVLTGVQFDEDKIGAVAYDSEKCEISYSFRDKVEGMFHSTGDLFASSLLGAFLNGHDIFSSVEIALSFTVSAINKTVELRGDSRFGLSFELCLPDYMRNLGVL